MCLGFQGRAGLIDLVGEIGMEMIDTSILDSKGLEIRG